MKYTIQVRTNGHPTKTIKRSLRGRCSGNFNPLFCTFDGEEHLVQSEAGDLSDPFRRGVDYTKSLYIEV
uniref:Uncharacterized protein n=1 Tax=viral metagenome TaxID=1070528 RepID=A0A6M3LMT5_9ZZZZ